MFSGGLKPLWRSRGLRWGVLSVLINGVIGATMFEVLTSQATGLLSVTIDRAVREQLSLLAARPPDMLPFMITSRMNGGPTVVTLVGLFRADRQPLVGDLSTIPDGLPLDGRAHEATSSAIQRPLRAAGRVLPDGRLLVVARDATDLVEIEGDFTRAALALAIPFALVTLMAGALLGMISERRLRRINETAERIIEGDLSLRLLANPEGDELDRLCAIVNRILRRLEEGLEVMRSAGENIAHDLRTPLTAVRARLERALEQAGPGSQAGRLIEQSINGIDQSLSTIRALLRIADLEHGRRISAIGVVEAARLLEETADIFGPVAEEAGLTLRLSLNGPGLILADRDLMIEAVANLLDNAIKFTPPGGEVVLGCQQDQARVVLSVSDSGPGIPAAQREAVLTRFVQLDSSRKTEGRGLGLSLVLAICKLHGFQLDIGQSDRGGALVSIGCRAALG